MRVLFGAASIAAMVGALWGDATPARACICAGFSAAEYLDAADVVLVGRATSMRPFDFELEARLRREGDTTYVVNEFGGEATVQVERYLKGRGPSAISFADDLACGPSIYREFMTHRHVIFLRFIEGPVTSPCFGSGSLEIPGDPAGTQLLTDISTVTGPGMLPDDSLPDVLPPDGTRFPWAAAGLAVLGPLAFLAGSAFVWRRGG